MAVIVALALGALLSAVAAAILSWPVMLLIGNASITSGGVVPAFGFWTIFWLVLAAQLLLVPNRTTTETD